MINSQIVECNLSYLKGGGGEGRKGGRKEEEKEGERDEKKGKGREEEEESKEEERSREEAEERRQRREVERRQRRGGRGGVPFHLFTMLCPTPFPLLPVLSTSSSPLFPSSLPSPFLTFLSQSSFSYSFIPPTAFRITLHTINHHSNEKPSLPS